ncbi:MAG: acyltransferase [Clostridiales bacterium]|nr:acyltransferase [Clostridiales bacterium]
MQRLISWYRDATQAQDGRIPALDGLRALMVLIVISFHIWQQSWLTPSIPWFGRRISLDFLLRSGYIWVDGMLLLSGFLLYLPYAQRGRALPSTRQFYRRRFFRIVPTYLLNLLVVFLVVALPERRYATPWAATRDILAHVTFTHNLFPFSYVNTPLNGALWTLAVEVQFYLLFPLLARAFRRMPVVTYLGMAGVAFGYRAWVGTLPDTSLYFNQLPAFLDVYANGFVAAGVYVSMRRLKEDGWSRVLMTVCAGLAVYGLLALCRAQAAEKGGALIRMGQMNRRFLLSVLLSVLMLGTSLGLGGVRLLLGNRVTRFLAEISFQMYMWHQVLAIQLRTWGIPASEFTLPNQMGDRVWQRSYVLLCYLGAFAISVLVTYLIEQPIARRFSGRRAVKST